MEGQPGANVPEAEFNTGRAIYDEDELDEYIPLEPDIGEADKELDTPIKIDKTPTHARKDKLPKRKLQMTSQRKTGTPNKPSKGKKQKVERTFMNADDIQELEYLFKDYLTEGKTPSRAAIKDLIEKCRKSGGNLARFRIEKIQKRLSNMVSTYSRKADKDSESDD